MRWFALALLGVFVAALVAVLASRLVSQQIGLASEPISAGDALAPRIAPAHRRRAPKPAPTPMPARERETEPRAASEPEPEPPPELETATPAPEASSGPESSDDGHAAGEGPDD